MGRRQTPSAAGEAVGANGAGLDSSQLLQAVLSVLTGKPLAPAPESPTGTAPPVLSPIDKMLGGEPLVGMKTPLAILAYVVLAHPAIRRRRRHSDRTNRHADGPDPDDADRVLRRTRPSLQ